MHYGCVVERLIFTYGNYIYHKKNIEEIIYLSIYLYIYISIYS